MTTNTTTDGVTDRGPLAFVGPQATELDRRLAQALEELRAAPHAEDDANDSNRPILIEALAWIALTALVWLAVALSL